MPNRPKQHKKIPEPRKYTDTTRTLPKRKAGVHFMTPIHRAATLDKTEQPKSLVDEMLENNLDRL
jgi:hypothetical protein